jgi:4-amino-4-deoxy-L-arabinose transferase-like glycosyltransferase
MEAKFNSPKVQKIILAVISLFGASAIFYLVSTYSISLNPDSSYYISVARHLTNGDGFIGYNKESFVIQAPLYPIILAFIKIAFGIAPLTSTGVINAIIFGFIIYITGLILLKHFTSSITVLFAIIAIIFSPVLIKFSLFALTEPLFIFLILLYLYYMDIYLVSKNRTALIMLSIFTALACVTRYIGVVIILSGVTTIAVCNKSHAKKKILDLITFLIISALPISVWIIRNLLVSHTLLGPRYTSSYTFFENLIFFFNTILHWFTEIKLNNRSLIMLLFVMICLIYILIFKISKKGKDNFINTLISPISIFILFYSLAIIISSTTTAYDRIADRLLCPIYVPIIILAFYVLDKVPNLFAGYYYQTLGRFFAAFIIIIWLSYIITSADSLIKDYIQKSGWEFGSRAWKKSQTISLLNSLAINKKYEIFSNAPDVVYILADKEAHWSPGRTYYNSPISIDNDGLPLWNDKGKAYLVWFNNIDRKFLFPVKILEKYTSILKIAQANDGEIYIVDIR